MGIQSMKVGFDLKEIVVLGVPVTCNVSIYILQNKVSVK